MSKTILLIDDDADDRELFVEALLSVDAKAVCYAQPSPAKVMLQWDNREMNLPDLIFLDVNLPGISGWDFLIELKKNPVYKKLPVIMYSTSSYSKDREMAQQLGALYFLTKPDDYQHLKRLLAVTVTAPTASLTQLLSEEVGRLSNNMA